MMTIYGNSELQWRQLLVFLLAVVLLVGRGLKLGDLGMGIFSRLSALSLGALMAATTFACADTSATPKASSSTQDLAKALGPHRAFELRPSGGFAYAPCKPFSSDSLVPRQECHDLPEISDPAFDALASVGTTLRGQAEPAEISTPQRSRPLWRLLFDRERSTLNRAVAELQELAERLPEDATIWNDLAVARVDRAQDLQNPEDLFYGLDALLQALELDPELREAHFNLALVMEWLSLRSQAAEAWKTYLAGPLEAGWADEGNVHLANLSEGARPSPREIDDLLETGARSEDTAGLQGLVDLYRSEAFRFGVERLLPAAARALFDGQNEEALALLSASRRLGEVLATTSGDKMVEAGAVALEKAGNGRSRELLLQGHLDFRAGLDLCEARLMEKAEPLLSAAEAELKKAGSPLAGWAVLYRAIAIYQRGALSEARSRLLPILQEPGNEDYPSLRARAAWMAGLIDHRQGRFFEALNHYRQSLKVYEATGQREEIAVMNQRLHADYEELGQRKKAMEHGYTALRSLPSPSPARAYTTLDEAGAAAARRGLLRAALAFREELVRHSEAWNNSEALAQALLQRSRDRFALGNYEPAFQDLEAAESHLATIEDAGLRSRISASRWMTEAELSRELGPRPALQSLDNAISYFTPAEDNLHLSRLWSDRARVLRRLGRLDEAEQDLDRALAAIEKERTRVADPTARISFLNASRRVYEEMVLFLYADREDTYGAFDVAERKRLRLGQSSKEVASVLDLLAALPAGGTLLAFEWTDEAVLVWLAADGHLISVRLPEDVATLRQRVESFHAALAHNERLDRIDRLAEGLYDSLIRTLPVELPSEETLVVIPDGPLLGIPFAALRDRLTGRYLIEDHEIRRAPSVSWYLQAARRSAAQEAERRPRSELTALVVADPDFDKETFSPLSQLPFAREEAANVTKLFRSLSLVGAEATASRVLEELPRYEIVHMATHSFGSDLEDVPTGFVLSPEVEADSGALELQDLEGLALPRARLAVLAACGTSGEGATGSFGLARPFLAAGVPAVVATLWPVEDRGSADLLSRFYRGYSAGLLPTESLRSTQINALRSAGSARHGASRWAGFIVYGL